MSGFLGGGIGPVALKRRRAVADWWQVAGQTCVAAYQPIGAATLAASYVNLANPGTYNAAPGVAPTLAAGGWQFDGSTQYLTTGIVPINNQQWSAIVRFSNVSAISAGMLFGASAVGTAFFTIQPNRSSSRIRYFSGTVLEAFPQLLAGNLAIAGAVAYRNGASDGSLLPGVGTFNSLYIGCYNQADTPTAFIAATIAALAIYKPAEPSTTPMSAADVAALTTRMQALA